MSPNEAAILLDLPLSATAADIRAAFRRRARLLHPDRVAGADSATANREFARITEACRVLIEWVSQPRGAVAPAPAAASTTRAPIRAPWLVLASAGAAVLGASVTVVFVTSLVLRLY